MPRLKILLCLTLILTVIFAPIALDFFPGGSSYAGSWWWEKPPHPDNAYPIPGINPCPKPAEQPAPVPEPTTLLLFGFGAVGLVALKKKLKK